jgi:hypothetical protein
MSNQKTNIPTPQKAVNGQTPTKEETSLTLTPTVEVVETEEATATSLRVVGRKSPTEVFERLEHGNAMRENYNRFKEKLEVCESFEKNYNNEALLLTVQNLGTGAEIQIQSIPMILEFVGEKVIKAGQSRLKALEDEIVSFAI